MCTCIELFLRPPLMQCYFCEFFFFSEFSKSCYSTVKSWTLEPGTPTEPTGPPVHHKNHLDEVQAGFGTTTRQEEYCVV